MRALAAGALASKSVAVLLNRRAGTATDESRLQQAFRAAGIEAAISSLDPGDLREAGRRLVEKRPPVLVAAGGDGTINAVAQALPGTGTALGIVPLGTLNHFARDLGIPLDPVEAARAIAAGRTTLVDVGEVNGSCFLNNASLGLYPGIVRERERQQRRLRRSKRAAMLWATLAVLQRPPLLELRLELDGSVRQCLAPFVFIGNNDYQLEGFNIGKRARLDRGMLNVYTTRSCSAGGLIALALRAIFGRLRQADDFLESSARSLHVASRRPRLLVATDGEVHTMETPLEFRVRPRSLKVLVP